MISFYIRVRAEQLPWRGQHLEMALQVMPRTEKGGPIRHPLSGFIPPEGIPDPTSSG